MILLNESRENAPPSEAWLTFADSGFLSFYFEEAPSFEINLDPVRSWPADEPNDAASPEDDTPAYHRRPSIYHWSRRYDDASRRSPSGNGSMQYKIDPSFGFDNRDLKLDGMMIRVWFDF
jgi:hypothetical protein